jgi:perosamine synthetase
MKLKELPPTDGLPLKWHDFWPLRLPPQNFESALKKFLGVDFVQVECSGTACLVIALEALKELSAARTVIIPGYTCPLVPMAIHKAGLKIKVCDTQKDNFDFDHASLANLCDADTLCIIPTHLGGLLADLKPTLDIAQANGSWVIEDAAHALGATANGRAVGTIGDIGFYSFAAGKGLTLYEGGALVARDPQIQEALKAKSRQFVPLSIQWELLRMAQLLGYGALYNPVGLTATYGYNLRRYLKTGDMVNATGEHFTQIPIHKISPWRKQVGANALPRLPQHLADAGQRGRRRAAQLNQIDGVRVLAELPDTRGTWPALMVEMESRKNCNRALLKLWASGLGVSKLFVHDLSSYKYLEELLPGLKTPNARALAERTLTVSNSAWVSDEDFRFIFEGLAESSVKKKRAATV